MRGFPRWAPLWVLAALLALAVWSSRDGMWRMHSRMGRGMMGGMPSRDVVPPGTRPEDLPGPESRGAALVNQYCTQCHNLPSPLLHSAAEWPQVVERMRQNITTLKRTPFTSAEREAIVRYLQEHARQRVSRRDPRRLTDSTSPE